MIDTTETVLCPVTKYPARFYCTKGAATYYLEPKMGTIFQAKMPTVSQMGEYADHEYESGVYKDYSNARELKAATARPRLAAIKELTSGKHLLDIGCSTGFFLEVAADEGFDIRGVEFSSVAISMAKPKIAERIVLGDINTLLAREASKFDVVTCFDIIEHVQDPPKLLREIWDILSPGGIIALSTPDTGHLLRYLMKSKWPMLQPMQHTVLFSKASMDFALRDCGFTNVRVETAYKTLTIDYLGGQLVATNPGLHRLYNAIRWAVPRPLRAKPIMFNIGELLAFAQKPL